MKRADSLSLSLLAGIALIAASGALPSATGTTGAPTTTVADLAWIAGSWTGPMWGGRAEEHWTAPDGDNMLGMFRFVRADTARFYELLVIEQEPSGPALKLKHFDRGLIGWEEKNEALRLPLVSATQTEAVFDDQHATHPTRLTYRRPARDSLLIRLESERDGKPNVQDFRFARIGHPKR